MDRGPGIPDVAAALNDGYSTVEDVGHRARRRPAHGRRVRPLLARARRHGGDGAPVGGSAGAGRRWPSGAVCIAHPGEEVSGDDWGVRELRGGLQRDGGRRPRPRARWPARRRRPPSAPSAPRPWKTRPRAPSRTATPPSAPPAGRRWPWPGSTAAPGSCATRGSATSRPRCSTARRVQRLVSLNGTAGLGVVRAARVHVQVDEGQHPRHDLGRPATPAGRWATIPASPPATRP